MAEGGINWGKIALGALAVTGAALVAPSVLDGIGDTLAQNAATGSTLASVASNAQSASSWIAGNVSSIFGAVGTTAAPESLQSLGGVWDALSTTGQNAINLASANPGKTAAIVGGAALGGATLGQWTSKTAASAAKPSGPGGMSYADYVRARQRLTAMAPPTRTA